MAVRITLSKSTCLLLGAGLGVTMALIIPSSCDADDKKYQKNNNNEFKNAATNTNEVNEEKPNNNNTFENAATNTSKINEENPSKIYGDKTMSEILEKAKLKIRKVWDEGWRIVLLNSKTSSTLSSDVYDSVQSSFPQTDSQAKGTFDPILHSGDTDSLSTIYTPVGKLSVSQYSSLTKRFKKGLSQMAKGYKRSNTSKNDSICKNYPKHASTLIEAENKTIIEENILNENTGTADESNSNNESDKYEKLVLSFRTPFSPIIRIFQAVKRFKRSKKRNKEKSDTTVETNISNGIEEVAGT